MYEYVAYDSEVECEFARRLDARDDIKLFVKVRCGQKHFEALGVPFAVAVTADEV